MATLRNHPGFWMRDDAEASLARWEADHGVISVNSAGRTVAEQQDLINRWNQGGTYNRPPYLYEPKRPASASAHVYDGGIAFDTSEWQRFLRTCADYGWYQRYSWDVVHFEYVPHNDKHRNRPAGGKTEEDDMAVEDLHTAFKKTGGQPVKAGQKVNLHINDAKDVTVARGPAKHVSGNLAFALSGGTAYSGAVQVTPVVRDYKDGKEVKRTSLRARETVFTGGDTLGEVAVNCALKANQRLSFEIGGSAQDFTVKSAVFRGMKIT
jgi:hypothetical protein